MNYKKEYIKNLIYIKKFVFANPNDNLLLYKYRNRTILGLFLLFIYFFNFNYSDNNLELEDNLSKINKLVNTEIENTKIENTEIENNLYIEKDTHKLILMTFFIEKYAISYKKKHESIKLEKIGKRKWIAFIIGRKNNLLKLKENYSWIPKDSYIVKLK
jgi:hypothetical protein